MCYKPSARMETENRPSEVSAEQETTPKAGRFDIEFSTLGMSIIYQDHEDTVSFELRPSEALEIGELISTRRKQLEAIVPLEDTVLKNINPGQKPFSIGKGSDPIPVNKNVQQRQK